MDNTKKARQALKDKHGVNTISEAMSLNGKMSAKKRFAGMTKQERSEYMRQVRMGKKK
jgi:hypothetical protein